MFWQKKRMHFQATNEDLDVSEQMALSGQHASKQIGAK